MVKGNSISPRRVKRAVPLHRAKEHAESCGRYAAQKQGTGCGTAKTLMAKGTTVVLQGVTEHWVLFVGTRSPNVKV